MSETITIRIDGIRKRGGCYRATIIGESAAEEVTAVNLGEHGGVTHQVDHGQHFMARVFKALDEAGRRVVLFIAFWRK